MASSGIRAYQHPVDGCAAKFKILSEKRKLDGVKLKYIIFAISDDPNPEPGTKDLKVVVEKASSEPDYEKFLEEFPENDGRYAFYDFEYDTLDARKTDKLIFISWVPDSLPIGKKTLYSTTKNTFLAEDLKFTPTANIHATDLDDISLETILSKVRKR